MYETSERLLVKSVRSLAVQVNKHVGKQTRHRSIQSDGQSQESRESHETNFI